MSMRLTTLTTLMTRMPLLLTLVVGVGCDDNGVNSRDHDDDSDHEHGKDDADAGTQLDFSRFDKALQDAIDAHNASADAKIKGASAVVVHEKLGTVHTKGFGEFAEDRLYLV